VLTGCGDDAGTATAAGGTVLENSALQTLDGEPTEFHAYLGRPLVLNFFAESCPPCVREMPAFDAVSGEVAGEVDFLGVSEDATAEAGRRIVESTGVGYEIVWDADGSALMTLRSMGLPTTAFVSAGGEVLEVHSGELSADDLRERLTTHFGL
jgi:thiol-disulfide isomerase/thioredoxin